jgi:hypothetical protein
MAKIRYALVLIIITILVVATISIFYYVSLSTRTSTRQTFVTTTTQQTSITTTTKQTSSTSNLAKSPVLDHTKKAFCGNCSSVSITITTSHINDVILVITYDSRIGVDTEAISSNPELDWKNRISFLTPNNMDEWYAIWASSGNITITMSTGSQNNTSEVILGFGVSGVNTTRPFDDNPSLVANATCHLSCGTSESVTLSTSYAGDFVIVAANGAAGGILAPDSTCTEINGLNSGGVAYVVEPTAQEHLTLTYTSQLTPGRWIMIADALRGIT